MSRRVSRRRGSSGTGACAIDDAVALTRHAGEIGAAAVLLLPPFYYKKVTDDGLFNFVSAVISGADRESHASSSTTSRRWRASAGRSTSSADCATLIPTSSSG